MKLKYRAPKSPDQVTFRSVRHHILINDIASLIAIVVAIAFICLVCSSL